MRCVRPGCQSIFSLDDYTSFCIDFDLLKAGIEGLSFSINFCYIPNYKTLSEVLLQKQKDDQILCYRQFSNPQKNLNYLHRIYELAENLFSNEKNQELTTKFYQETIQSLLPNDYNLYLCEITRLGIQIPARCSNCKDYKVCDLRFYTCILNQVKDETDVEGVRVKKTSCPLCETLFLLKPRPPERIIDQVYIDGKMMKFFVSVPFNQRSLNNYINFLQREQDDENLRMDNQREKLLRRLPIIEWEYPKMANIDMYMLNLKCLYSGDKLTIPVRSRSCQPPHYDCFDRDSLIESLKQNSDLDTFKCPQCNCYFGSIDNLFIDKILFFILQRQQQVKKNETVAYVNLIDQTLHRVKL